MRQLLEDALGWTNTSTTPPGHHLCIKVLSGSGLHTMFGMLGYCLKDWCEEYFQCIAQNIVEEDLNEGSLEFILYCKTVERD